jgi:hypothetical protein
MLFLPARLRVSGIPGTAADVRDGNRERVNASQQPRAANVPSSRSGARQRWASPGPNGLFIGGGDLFKLNRMGMGKLDGKAWHSHVFVELRQKAI